MKIDKTWLVIIGAIVIIAFIMQQDGTKKETGEQRMGGYVGYTNALTARYAEFHLGQTFSVNQDFDLTEVHLILARSGNLSDIKIELKDAKGGMELQSTIYDGDSLPESAGEKITIEFPMYPIEANQNYTLVLSAPDGDQNENFLWVKLNSEDKYGEGELLSSSNRGQSWFDFKNGTYDMYFELWGFPK